MDVSFSGSFIGRQGYSIENDSEAALGERKASVSGAAFLYHF
jgi:hypothetical protein